jgi:hypothetical protein
MPDGYPGGTAVSPSNPADVKLLVFDDPDLQGPHEWLVDDPDVHDAMRALARQAYRRARRTLPDGGLEDRLRAHGTVDARPYEPPAAA